MVANYFLGAVVLILTTDIVLGADLCLCSGDIYRYSSDCCSVHPFTTKKPIWELGITQRPILDMWWTERPIWYGRTTSKVPIFERSTTRRFFWDLWTTRKPIWDIRPTSKTPAWDIWTTKKPIFERSTTRRAFWDLWTTRKQIWDIWRTSKTTAWEIRTTKKTNWEDDEWLLKLNRPTTRSPYLDSYDSGSWSTTHGSDTTNVAATIGASVGGVTAFAILCCLIAGCVRVKRGRQGAVLEHHQPPSLPRNVGILIVFRRIFVWRCQVRADTEHLISNPQTRTNNQEPVTPVAPPPYTPASPSVSPPPYSEYI